MLSRHLFKLRNLIIVATWFSTLLVLSGCGLGEIPDEIDSSTDKAVAVLDQAITELADANADWQEILNNLARDLPAEVQSTIGFEVSRTLNRAISASGSEVKCIVDFLHDRVREDLIRIKAGFLKQEIPPLSPVFCDVESVDMAMINDGRQNNLLIFGYNFDIQNPVQILLNENGQELDVNREQKNLFVLTHYKMELNLGRNGVPLTSASQYFVIRWDDQVISEIPIKQPALPACKTETFTFVPTNPITYLPPHTEGDAEYSGNGPKVYVRVELWPQDLGAGAAWEVNILMNARETESDWTTADGFKEIRNFFQLPDGYVLDEVIRLRSEAQYTDDDHADDTLNPTTPGGPVHHFVFVGDTDGSEAGTKTSVTIYFNTIKFRIRQVENCR